MRRLQDTPERGDEGFMLITAIVMIFMVLLVLSVAAPRVAKEIQRDREQESAHRAQQYTRAIRIFYQKFKRYPTSIEQLEKTNNQRFLRQRYIDPLTGKDDWRIIHVGENQTTVKGFFGDDLPGLTAGLGSAAGMASPSGSTFAGGGAATNSFGGTSTPGGTNSSSTSAFGTPGTTQSGTGAGTSGTNSSLGSAAGMASQGGGTDPLSGGGGPIMGVGSAKSGEAMLVVNEQTTYDTWEFLYDPRIEQLYAKANLLGGVASGSGTSGFGSGSGTGLGSAAGMASPGTNGTPPATTTAPTANPPSTGP